VEGSKSDIKGKVGAALFKATVAKSTILAKLNEVKALKAYQSTVSLELDFCGTRRAIYGHVYVLVAKVGDATSSKNADAVMKDQQTQVWEWSKCITPITVNLPRVDPWEKEKQFPNVEDKDIYGIYVVFDIKRTQNEITSTDVVVVAKSVFLFKGEMPR